LPAGLAAQPAPVLILLHGANGGPEEMIGRFRAQADANGVVLLAPRSRGASWDLILKAARSTQLESADLAMLRPPPRPAADPPRIDAALARLARHIAIDRSRIGLAGFSDGASYALSLGPRRAHAYRAILAFSPGMMILPSRVTGGQHIFIAYGRQDGPFTDSGSRIAMELRRRRQNVTVLPFEGGHTIPEAVAAKGVAFFLEGDRRVNLPSSP
jgi:phospholipase/carboxylesterase